MSVVFYIFVSIIGFIVTSIGLTALRDKNPNSIFNLNSHVMITIYSMFIAVLFPILATGIFYISTLLVVVGVPAFIIFIICNFFVKKVLFPFFDKFEIKIKK